MITPSTTIKFLKVPFSQSQNNVLKFSDIYAQLNYMNSKLVFTKLSCSYQREGEGEFIRVNESIDKLYNCNYVMFQNSNFMDRWFYAFIDKIEYISSNMTAVYIKLDSYQTFQFDFTLEKSFIERQTPSVDYYNTLEDTPSAGELKSVFEFEKLLFGNFFILFNSDPTTEDSSTSSVNYPQIGSYSMPVYMCLCQSASVLSEIVQAVSNKGRADRIQACFFSPATDTFNNITVGVHSKGDLPISNDLVLISELGVDDLYKDITVPITYSPVFKKELSYPYAKLEIVDKITGKYIELDLSKFSDPLNPQFRLICTVSDNPEYKLIPLNYNGISYSVENALVVDPSAEIPVFSNSYAKYLKDNKTANIINGVLSGASAVGSIMTGNIAGAVGSFGAIAQVVNADKVAKSQPNQVTGIKGDACDYLNFNPSILFRLKVMDSNHMDIARNFWNAYGYPERKVTTFSNTSEKFNFYKTVECNIVADSIPTEYQRELENIFNKGVTVWNRDFLQYA